jgi:hypothetical protein
MDVEKRLPEIESAFTQIAAQFGFHQIEREIGDTSSALALYKSDVMQIRVLIDRGEEVVEISWLPDDWFDMSLLINAFNGTPPRQMWSFDEQIKFLGASYLAVLARVQSHPHQFSRDLRDLAWARRTPDAGVG